MKLNTAMIMAAGFGTRMGVLTQDVPKPMLALQGRPMIEHTLDHVRGAGIATAVINLHYRSDRIREYLDGCASPEIRFSEEQPEILDTGGGIVQALPMLGDAPFCVLNSDAVFLGPNPIGILMQHWDDASTDALLLKVPKQRAIAYTREGDFFLDEATGKPTRRGDAESAPYVYAGVQIIRPEAFRNAPEGAFSTNLIWNDLLAKHRLRAAVYPGRWVDVGTPGGLEAAETELAARS